MGCVFLCSDLSSWCAQGSLESLSATQLGAAAIKGAVRRAGLSDRTEEIGEVFMGNVLSANLGQVS